MGHSKSSPKREVYSNTILQYKKQEKHRIDNLILHPKQLGKKEPKKPPKLVEGKKSYRSEQINEKEMKETIVKINKTKS